MKFPKHSFILFLLLKNFGRHKIAIFFVIIHLSACLEEAQPITG